MPLTFDEYDNRVSRKRNLQYPGEGTFLGAVYCALKANGEAGEIAEKIGKAWRDNNGVLDTDRKEALIYEIGDELWYLNQLCTELGTTLSFAAEMNIYKLAGRDNRGTIKGEGDDR